ncbi:MAG: M20/M25/M40 family metallo-hydrolase, partial [Nitrospinota bacterium]
ASTATTDSRFFLLYYDIPTTCYGAEGANMHGIDEYVSLPTLLEATKVIALFLLRWCGVVRE